MAKCERRRRAYGDHSRPDPTLCLGVLVVNSYPDSGAAVFLLDALPVLVYYSATMKTTAGLGRQAEAKAKVKAKVKVEARAKAEVKVKAKVAAKENP